MTFSFTHLEVARKFSSSKGDATKSLYILPDGNGIEAVLLLYEKRQTVCISTQAGCGMGCVFCATGQMGLLRNLTRGEIVEQVIHQSRHLQTKDSRLTNIVIMGMGEPFHNYQETMGAIDILNNKDGMDFGARRITVSTVGIVPAIKRFTAEKRQVNLAVSLHTINDDIRSSLLPVNRKYPVDMLLQACNDYVNYTGRRITFEWALISNVNDSANDAIKLSKKLQMFTKVNSSLCHVNLIPLNPTPSYRGKDPERANAISFKDILNRNGISCTIRMRRGLDINASCGQLATRHNRPESNTIT